MRTGPGTARDMGSMSSVSMTPLEHASQPLQAYEREHAWQDLWWLLLIVLLATALRAFRLGHQSLWTDEILTSLSADGSLHYVLTQTNVNTNIPPGYYVLVHYVMALGRDEVVLRLPSVLCGVISVILLYAVVRAWLGRQVALVSAACLAISPLHIWYSQEARPYALLIALSLLSIWLLQRLLERPSNAWLRTGFVLSAAAMVYTHTLAVPFLAFLGTYALMMTPREVWWRRWAPMGVAVVVLLIPAGYRLMVFKPDAYAEAYRGFSPVFAAYAFWTFAAGYTLGPTLTELHRPDRVAITFRFLPVIIPVALLYGALLVAGVIALRHRSRMVFRIVAAWVLFPVAFAVAGALLTPHPFNVRYVLLCVPAFALVIALGVLSLNGAWLRIGVAAALGLASALSLQNYFFDARYFREDNRGAGAFVARYGAPGDLVIADMAYTARSLRYYARRPDVVIVGYPPQHPDTTVAADGALPLWTGNIDADLRRLLAGRARYWLFVSRTYGQNAEREILGFSDANFRRVRELRTDNDILLILYQRPTE